MADRRHFHIWRGIGGGYVPDCDGTYETLAEARQALADIKAEFYDWRAEMQADELTYAPDIRVSGDIRRQGYVQIAEHDSAWLRTAWIERCSAPACDILAELDAELW